MARRSVSQWRQKPDFPWIRERVRSYAARTRLETTEGEPNFARISQRLGFSSSVVQGWFVNEKWPEADKLIACAVTFDEPWLDWMQRGGFAIPAQKMDLTPTQFQILQTLRGWSEHMQEWVRDDLDRLGALIVRRRLDGLPTTDDEVLRLYGRVAPTVPTDTASRTDGQSSDMDVPPAEGPSTLDALM